MRMNAELLIVGFMKRVKVELFWFYVESDKQRYKESHDNRLKRGIHDIIFWWFSSLGVDTCILYAWHEKWFISIYYRYNLLALIKRRVR